MDQENIDCRRVFIGRQSPEKTVIDVASRHMQRQWADAETGEIVPVLNPVLPTIYKCPQSGAALPVGNPTVWVYPEGVE